MAQIVNADVECGFEYQRRNKQEQNDLRREFHLLRREQGDEQANDHQPNCVRHAQAACYNGHQRSDQKQDDDDFFEEDDIFSGHVKILYHDFYCVRLIPFQVDKLGGWDYKIFVQ